MVLVEIELVYSLQVVEQEVQVEELMAPMVHQAQQVLQAHPGLLDHRVLQVLLEKTALQVLRAVMVPQAPQVMMVLRVQRVLQVQRVHRVHLVPQVKL